MKIAAKKSFPTVVSLIFFQLIGFVIIYFVGHVENPTLLPGVGLGIVLLNVLVFALSQGLNGAIETFVAADYAKAILALEEHDSEGVEAARESKEFGHLIEKLPEH
jgi:Na+-driven multidrug efflux pump